MSYSQDDEESDDFVSHNQLSRPQSIFWRLPDILNRQRDLPQRVSSSSRSGSMAEQGGASGGVSFSSSWGKDLSDSARQRYLESMMAGIMEMGMEGQNSDIEIIVQGQSFPCHKLLLSAGSPYFKAMFSSGMMEQHGSRLELPDIEKETFAAFKEYIYTGIENITQDNVVPLLRAAAIFQVEPLQKSCEQFLGTGMDNENCLELFKISRAFGCNTLFEKCKPYVLEGFNGLWKTQEFVDLEFDEVQSIVKDDDLVPVSEEEICEAVLRWIRGDEAYRKQYTGKLFEHIRMIQISPEYLINELYTDELLTEDRDCKRYLDEARNFHMLPARQQEYCSPRFHLRNSDDLEEVILITTEFDMERTAQMYQDGKCLWAFSFQQARWYTICPIPIKDNPGTDFQMVSFRNDLYLAGGTNNSKSLLHFDNDRNEWELCETQMKRGRSGHIMAAVRESIFVVAGKNPKARAGSSNHVLSSVESYNIRSRKWETIGEISTAVHSAASFVIGEKIYIFGGFQQDGTWSSDIQVFDTRKRESSTVGQIPMDISPPFKLLKIGNDNILVSSDCKIYNVEIKSKKDEEVKVNIKFLDHILSKALRPVIDIANFRGNMVVLTGSEHKPDAFSKMTLVDLSNKKETSVKLSSKNMTIPKLILSCNKGIIDKQYMYHTYYQ
ncbi:kelch-like protein 24 [Saccostrea cucullata]|uniref:kelch-like protein 24 n=1 Tax=Saccostrea cuccullata TaxID=36930 RepID=UPI002ED42738